MKHGLAISYPLLPLPASLQLAEEADARGLDLVAAGDGYNDTFTLLSAAAMRTSRVRLVSTIATPTRTPVTTAHAAATLAEVSAGRYTLGLGVMPRERSEDWHAIPHADPLGRMHEFVAAIRRAWEARPGAPTGFKGRAFRFEGYAPDRDRPHLPAPIVLGVTRPGMSRLAGEIANGVVVNAVHSLSWLTDVTLPAITTGLDARARGRAEFEVGVLQHCAIDDDPGRARSLARHGLAPYVPTAYFAELLEHHGFERELELRQHALRARGSTALLEVITDRVVAEMAVVGTVLDVREQLEAYTALADFAVLSAPPGHPPDVTIEQAARIIGAFGRH